MRNRDHGVCIELDGEGGPILSARESDPYPRGEHRAHEDNRLGIALSPPGSVEHFTAPLSPNIAPEK